LPLGIITVLSYFPGSWDHRIIDEMCDQTVTDEDLQWADIVCFTGMYVQARRACELARRARTLGKVTVAGGPSVTLGPARYGDLDILHMGELGNATYELIKYLDTHPERPASQIRFTTEQAIPLDEHPLPAYDKINLNDYLLLTMQYSKGCPFNCEFCDVIEIFGRIPECKTPARMLREFDLIYAHGWRGSVFAVSDNFIGNHKLAREVLPQIADWQHAHDYPFGLVSCATLDVAHHPDILEKMRQANFIKVQIGIESAEAATLIHTQKKQNLLHPMVESIKRIHDHGIDIAATFIVGFDTDTLESGKAMIALIHKTNLVFTAIGMLTALEGTQLSRRLEKEGRLSAEFPHMHYKMGDENAFQMFEETTSVVYNSLDLFKRFAFHVTNVYTNKLAETRMTPARMLRMAKKELGRKLGRTDETIIDRNGRLMQYKPATPKLGMAIRTFVTTARRFVRDPELLGPYLDFLKLCIEYKDIQSALMAPVVVAMWTEMAQARWNLGKKGKVVAKESIAAERVTRKMGPNGTIPGLVPSSAA
jgi:radical SAM superfamily enzyme YgiQ (UPF0313 family)